MIIMMPMMGNVPMMSTVPMNPRLITTTVTIPMPAIPATTARGVTIMVPTTIIATTVLLMPLIIGLTIIIIMLMREVVTVLEGGLHLSMRDQLVVVHVAPTEGSPAVANLAVAQVLQKPLIPETIRNLKLKFFDSLQMT
jgi:hypothetical protein